MSGTTNGVVQVERRKWDKAEYALRAQENEANAKVKERPGAPKEDLKERDFSLDFKGSVGKSTVCRFYFTLINSNILQLQAKNSGFYCAVCDCTMKDSANYTDHLNGKKRM